MADDATKGKRFEALFPIQIKDQKPGLVRFGGIEGMGMGKPHEAADSGRGHLARPSLPDPSSHTGTSTLRGTCLAIWQMGKYAEM